MTGPDPDFPDDPTDPAVVHARREAFIIGLAWLAATIYCCVASSWLGYSTPDRPLDRGDVRPIAGIPAWVVWGYLAPWAVCGLFTAWFAGWFMADDDLGGDGDG